jgi:hypothetical protein
MRVGFSGEDIVFHNCTCIRVGAKCVYGVGCSSKIQALLEVDMQLAQYLLASVN